VTSWRNGGGDLTPPPPPSLLSIPPTSHLKKQIKKKRRDHVLLKKKKLHGWRVERRVGRSVGRSRSVRDDKAPASYRCYELIKKYSPRDRDIKPPLPSPPSPAPRVFFDQNHVWAIPQLAFCVRGKGKSSLIRCIGGGDNVWGGGIDNERE
jgi:hypothetical protein